jgi:hypothetical protein
MRKKVSSVDVGVECYCGHEFGVTVTFGEEAQCFGPVETCHDGSATEFEPGECPECGAEIDKDDVHLTASEIAAYMDEDEDDDD